MQMKSMNKKKVLQWIQTHSPTSRAEIAANLSLSKPTVSLLVDELMEENWVYEKGSGESSSQGGRRPIRLYFNEKAAYIIGTDIGGTNVKMMISDLMGNVVCSRSFLTHHYVEKGLIPQIAKEVEGMLEACHIPREKVLGMGVGVPGITQNGIVLEAPSLNWIRYPFIDLATQHFSFPVYVDNDVNVAALGEQWLGNAKRKKHVLFIAVGTGIGSGIILDDQLYRGYGNAAGEIGYMVTNKNEMKTDFKPIFHRYGYLESVAGGKAIGKRFTECVLKEPQHPAYSHAQQEELSGELAFTFAKKGDRVAVAVVDEALEHLAYGMINAASLLNPEVIILGGGVCQSADYVLPKLRQIVNHYLPSSVELKATKLGDHAGVLGAVSLFLREHESMMNFS
ncbi:ROK family transcriptional regulator [Metabacillus iocasae]|uniref:Glucokinase n=1 Tax=Priestia iocasae TaxID=2291674 RepID=A0ABS2QTW6_9BACI|nr:ROK family transcriptional regulator [Metabacillus iocasae]MBM7702372.1 glucokinase [Metabacillus iocasae]